MFLSGLALELPESFFRKDSWQIRSKLPSVSIYAKCTLNIEEGFQHKKNHRRGGHGGKCNREVLVAHYNGQGLSD